MVSLGIALLAVGVAVGAWFRPLPKHEPPLPPTYTSQQVAEAKRRVCAAYAKVHHAVLANTGRGGGNDPATLLGLAANARIALFDSGEYLLKVLQQESATPNDFAAATRALADSYQMLAINYMAEAGDSELQDSQNAVERAGSRVAEMCR
ncbi:hypothetical protein A5636_05805 [Mycobacterium asiaticum]|uniref:Alanine and proline rich membrane protein n=1 Tax=Mycobacterium asiaticum TaxID=1790 RepID=A0A1A3N1W4_MYCAS|nr:hypothetical protein A5636_05805 [Mycobacterium asiaticum]